MKRSYLNTCDTRSRETVRRVDGERVVNLPFTVTSLDRVVNVYLSFTVTNLYRVVFILYFTHALKTIDYVICNRYFLNRLLHTIYDAEYRA